MKKSQAVIVSTVTVVLLLAVATAIWAADRQYKTDRIFQTNAVTLSAFTNHPDSAAGNEVEPIGSTNIYLYKANPCTTQAILIGPWRSVFVAVRIDASNTETDDSVDTRIYYDGSWDGVHWTLRDSTTLTDTLEVRDQLDSALTMFQGSYLRLRPDPTTGMRQDTVGYRPFLNCQVIYK